MLHHSQKIKPRIKKLSLPKAKVESPKRKQWSSLIQQFLNGETDGLFGALELNAATILKNPGESREELETLFWCIGRLGEANSADYIRVLLLAASTLGDVWPSYQIADYEGVKQKKTAVREKEFFATLRRGFDQLQCSLDRVVAQVVNAKKNKRCIPKPKNIVKAEYLADIVVTLGSSSNLDHSFDRIFAVQWTLGGVNECRSKIACVWGHRLSSDTNLKYTRSFVQAVRNLVETDRNLDNGCFLIALQLLENIDLLSKLKTARIQIERLCQEAAPEVRRSLAFSSIHGDPKKFLSRVYAAYDHIAGLALKFLKEYQKFEPAVSCRALRVLVNMLDGLTDTARQAVMVAIRRLCREFNESVFDENENLVAKPFNNLQNHGEFVEVAMACTQLVLDDCQSNEHLNSDFSWYMEKIAQATLGSATRTSDTSEWIQLLKEHSRHYKRSGNWIKCQPDGCVGSDPAERPCDNFDGVYKKLSRPVIRNSSLRSVSHVFAALLCRCLHDATAHGGPQMLSTLLSLEARLKYAVLESGPVGASGFGTLANYDVQWGLALLESCVTSTAQHAVEAITRICPLRWIQARTSLVPASAGSRAIAR